MSIRKQIVNSERLKRSGGIVRLLDDMEMYIGESLLDEVAELYGEGHTPEAIGEAINRDPDEVFIALFHLARQLGDNIKPFAKRL